MAWPGEHKARVQGDGAGLRGSHEAARTAGALDFASLNRWLAEALASQGNREPVGGKCDGLHGYLRRCGGGAPSIDAVTSVTPRSVT